MLLKNCGLAVVNHSLVGVPFRVAAPHARKDGFVMGDKSFWEAGVFPGTSCSNSISLTCSIGSRGPELPHLFLVVGKWHAAAPSQTSLWDNCKCQGWTLRIHSSKGFTYLAKVKKKIANSRYNSQICHCWVWKWAWYRSTFWLSANSA